MTRVVLAIRIGSSAAVAMNRAVTRRATPDASGAQQVRSGNTSAENATATATTQSVRSAPRAQAAGIALPASVIGAAKVHTIVVRRPKLAAPALGARAATTEPSVHASGSGAAEGRAAPARAPATQRTATALSAQVVVTPQAACNLAHATVARTAGLASIATNVAPRPTTAATRVHASPVQTVSTSQGGATRTAALTHFQGVDRASTSSAPVAPAPPALRESSRRPIPIRMMSGVKIVAT